jgi:hypothetical protein
MVVASLVLRIMMNLFMAVYAFLTISYFIKQKRLKLEMTTQLRSFSCHNILVLTVLGITFALRISIFLTIDEINILTLFTPACHLNAAFVIWVI